MLTLIRTPVGYSIELPERLGSELCDAILAFKNQPGLVEQVDTEYEKPKVLVRTWALFGCLPVLSLEMPDDNTKPRKWLLHSYPTAK